jgi:hypothetical protein
VTAYVTLTHIIAVLVGAGLTILGTWSAAVADRIRGGRRDRAARATEPTPPPPAREPRRAKHRKPRAAAAPPSDLEQWLIDMGYSRDAANVAARRALLTTRDQPLEAQIRAAMTHLPVDN